MKRGLAISGGGAKGAFGGGVINYLVNKGVKWNKGSGTSTGSLLMGLALLGEMDKLKEGYTSVSQGDIFTHNPFNKKGNISFWKALWRVITSKTSLGNANKLKNTIRKFFTLEDYVRLKDEKKEIFACVCNYTDSRTEYKSSLEYEYEDFIDWMLASASVPIGMDLVKKEDKEYLDGGVTEHVPLQQLIDSGCDIIDVIVLRPEVQRDKEKWESKNIFNVFMRTIAVMENEVSRDDIAIGKLYANGKDVTLNIYYTPYNLTDNSLLFNKDIMLKWWKEGFAHASNIGCKELRLTRSNRIKHIN